MLSVSSDYLQAINADVRNMPYRVTLAGAVVLDQTRVPNMTLDESLSGSSGVSLGTANSATLKLTIRDPDIIDYNDMRVEPESGLTLPDGTVEWIPLGKFWVTSSSTHNDYKTVQLTCADGMYHLTGEYVSKLTYPTALKNVMYEIVSQTGIDFVEPETWPDIEIKKNPQDLKLTYRAAIGYIAGCCGRNARFNRYGALEFAWYSGSGITIERRNQYLDGMIRLNDKPLEVKFEVTGEKETFTVTTISDANGSIIASPNAGVTANERVTVTIRPLYEYELATITAVTDGGEEVVLVGNADKTEYYYDQPEDNVTITASFRSVSGGPFELSTSSQGNGTITYRISGNEKGDNFFDEGATVSIYVTPNSGYVIDTLVTAPSAIALTVSGSTTSGGTVYSFTMPQSDVSITAYFKEDDRYLIETAVGGGTGYVVVENTTTGGAEYHEGDVISVRFARSVGYVFSRYEANVAMVQVDSDDFKFVMPSHDVSITAYFEEEIDASKEGMYSFLQHPDVASPPTIKPYWAVFYKFSEDVGANARYYLVWFDSWDAVATTSIDDKTAYAIQMDGYYYCQGENNGYGTHQWNTDVWSGNGASSSALTWETLLSRWNEGYCLLASNAHLYHTNDTLVFKRCDTAISTTQTDWLVDGVDAREQGALGFYNCPDTYSTPLPGSNWLLLNRAYVYKADDSEYYTTLFSGTGIYALYTDGISVERIGQHFENVDLTFYKLTFPSVTIVPYMSGGGFYESAVKTIDEACYILIGDPAYSSEYGIATGGLVENTCGLYGANTTTMAFNNNSCIVCDCATAVASTFSLLRSTYSSLDSDAIVIDSGNITATSSGDSIVLSGSGIEASADGDAIELVISSIVPENVTVTYTNPFISEKMISAISERVQGVTYTPAKVKHRGNPAFQAGDIVTVPDREGNYHSVLLIQQTLTFGGGMNSEISCPGQTEKSKNFSANGPTTTQIKEAVTASNANLERKLSTDNALVYAALNKAIVAVSQKADANSATLESLVEWRGETNATMAAIKQTADKNTASIELIVENGAVKGSAIFEAINGETTLKIDADRVDIEGKVTADYVSALGAEFTTGKIGGWNITASGLSYGTWNTGGSFILWPEGFSTSFGSFGVQNWVMTSGTTFGVTSSGALYANDAYITGEISSTVGNIGDWQITDHGIWYATNTYLISLGDSEVEDSGTFKGIHLYIGNNHFVVDTRNDTLAIRIKNVISGASLEIDDDGGRLNGTWTLNGNAIATS